MFIRATLFALTVSFTATAFAQDSLFYTNGNVIVGQVTEIGLDVVKYRTHSDGQPVVIEVSKQDLSKIKLKDGQAYMFTSPSSESPSSAAFLGRKHALFLDVIAPALNHVTIGYEQVLGNHINLVLKAGYIGLWSGGIDNNNDLYNSKGGLFTAGLKFKLPRSPKRLVSSRDAHPLAGWYLSPELTFSAWSTTYYTYGGYNPYPPFNNFPDIKNTDKYTSAALVLNIGREFFLGEHITFDISGGLGYGGEWRNGEWADSNTYGNNYYYHGHRQQYAFTHTFFGDTTPLVVTGGLRFGYVF